MKRGIIILAISILGCVDPYNPKEITGSEPILVVDGFVNTLGPSKITLSRTQNLDDNSEPFYETGAEVWIEDENGNKTVLMDTFTGEYRLAIGNLTQPRYRLRIKTLDQQEYASEFVSVLQSPEIDSVTWRSTEDQKIEILVSTHGGPSDSPYYLWTFDETWAYRSFLNSQYVFDVNTKSVSYNGNQNIYTCWRTGLTSKISIESTKRFSENRVANFQLTNFYWNDERTRLKYSVLVNQYSLTKDAFEYWQQLKKSNEGLGTIFGALPSEISGNIKNLSDDRKRVVGFFSVGASSQKRIFISNSEFPKPITWDTPYKDCTFDTLFLSNIPDFSGPPYLLGGEIYVGNFPVGFSYSIAFCVDCRLSGGTNIKPDYWE